MSDLLEKIKENRAARRRFIKHAGIAGLGLIGASQIELTQVMAQSGELNDVNILNFALNLEYLEAEFYVRSAFGRGLSDGDVTGTGTLGPVIGGRQVPFTTPSIREYAEEIAADEEAHVRFLRAGLGSAAVARPTIDLQDSFTKAARAAGLIGPMDTFDPYADENSFLLAAYIFEDVGVTAYKGAARFLTNKDFLEAAAGILAVEAYHASNIRTVLYARGFFDAAQRISDLRDAADGPADLDQGILLNGKANIVPSDGNGIAFSRTPTQVLSIVYLGGRSAGFGFFPNRMNGAIR
jgi:hypothetical protein